jgi:hypothetical protein
MSGIREFSSAIPLRKLTEPEKLKFESETLAKEKPRNPNHMVIVAVEDETDDDGNPIITVLRMRAASPGKKLRS